MKDITVILPIHVFGDKEKEYFTRSKKSIKDLIDTTTDVKAEFMIVGPKDVLEDVKKENDVENTIYVENDGETDFCSQVNKGVKECKTEYFIISEIDDGLHPKWVNMAKPYIEENENISVFLPLIETFDERYDTPVGYMNEIAWSNSFANENELGYLDLDGLLTYYQFNLTGGIIKTSEFIRVGGLKPSIKISFGYEFLLRVANSTKGIFIVPKVGYFHTINREGSLSKEYMQTISQEEGSWWIELATKEYLFKKDRKKTYEEDNKEE